MLDQTRWFLSPEGDATCALCGEVFYDRDRAMVIRTFVEEMESHRCPTACAFEPVDPDVEPEPGSVVMVFGCTGTAYQRFQSTGLWYSGSSASASGRTYQELLALDSSGRLPLLIVDSAAHRPHSRP